MVNPRNICFGLLLLLLGGNLFTTDLNLAFASSPPGASQVQQRPSRGRPNWQKRVKTIPRKVLPAIGSAARQSGRMVSTVGKGLGDGLRHTATGIIKKPVKFAGMLLGVGAISAGLEAAHIPAEPVMMALSGMALGWDLRGSQHQWRSAHGLERLRIFVSRVVFPVALVTVTGVLGHKLGNHGEAASVANVAEHAGLRQAAQAAAQGVVTAGDSPLVLIAGGDHAEEPKLSRPKQFVAKLKPNKKH